MIEATGLTMRYGATLALDNASFKVGRGGIMGLLGPNGAGKTTAMNILSTHILPTGGTATIGGFDIHKEPLEVRRLLGYLPEDPPLYKDMEVAEYIRFVGRGRGLPGAKLKERIDWVVDACGLEEVFRKPVHALSRGFKQRVGLAQALVHDPLVLILDEPTTGLDPMQIIGIRKLIKNLASDKTVIFSTHIMQEAAAITDRIVIINEGRIIADSTTTELQGRYTGNLVTRVSARAPKAEMEALLKSMPGVEGVTCVEEGLEGGVTFEVAAPQDAGIRVKVAEAVQGRGWLLLELTDKLVSLEDVFISLVRKTRMKALPEPGAASAQGGTGGEVEK